MVRMWGLKPKILCMKHLAGEHNEMHKIVGSIRKKKSIEGYVRLKEINVKLIRKRHKSLEEELNRRKITGENKSKIIVNSPLPKFSYYGKNGSIDLKENLKDLLGRCKECKKRFLKK